MSKKPPRPPAPKLGGAGAGGGLSFSFKALEEEDDEELTVFTGKFDKQISEEREKQAQSKERERSTSKTPERSRTGSDHDGGLKSVNPLEQTKQQKEKMDDGDGKRNEGVSEKEKEITNADGLKSEVVADTTSDVAPGENDSIGNEMAEANSDFYDADGDSRNDTEYKSIEIEDDVSNIEMVDEYYNPDYTEDFSDLPGVATLRQRSRFPKSRKVKPIVPVAPVSMSKLSEKVAEETTSDVNNPMDVNKNADSQSKTHEKPSNKILSLDCTRIPTRKLVFCALFILLYMVIPLPSYISGMIVGIVLSSGGWMLYLWVTQPSKPREPIPEDPPFDKLPPMPVPEMKEPKEEDCSYKSWMNEVMDYVPDTYSINHAHSIHVHLEGTTLRLRRAKNSIPKRAMWDEPTPAPQFIHQRHFDIEGSRVLLIPPGLVAKRLWSKKYPICIALAKDGKKHNFDNSKMTSGQIATGRISNSSSFDSIHGIDVVNEQKCDSSVLYLFARTCHQKEQWYRRLEAATKGTPLKNHILEIRRVLNTPQHRRSSSCDSLKQKRLESADGGSSTGSSSPTSEEPPWPELDLGNFVTYMSRLMPRDTDNLPSSPVHKDSKNGDAKQAGIKTGVARGIVCDPSLLPLNALLGRCFYDFLRDVYWINKIKDKLQKKLSKIHIPYFIEELQISDIDLGTEVPVIRRTNKPFLDESGFWVDLDITYSGKFKMTIETKVNLLKLKKSSSSGKSPSTHHEKKSAVTHSEEEDSAESSTDEEDETGTTNDDGTPQSGGTGKKIMNVITRITASKYFQSAAENKYIKKAMTEVSNTPLILTVELQKLTGTVALNIPPPPSDRFWYGFRGNPQLWLVAKPKVGVREVTMSHITDWIEKKLALEFQHVFVLPNMDDLVIPIMHPGHISGNMPQPRHSNSGSEV